MAHNSRIGRFVMTPITNLTEAAIGKPGLNIVNARNPFSYFELPSIKPSTNLTEAQLKARRLYKRICRYVSSKDTFYSRSALDDP